MLTSIQVIVSKEAANTQQDTNTRQPINWCLSMSSTSPRPPFVAPDAVGFAFHQGRLMLPPS